MKLSEARKIVGEIIRWQMHHMGILPEAPAHIDYSLPQLLEANKIVERANKSTKRDFIEGKTYKRKIQLTLDDRIIAAVYVIMNYGSSREPITACNGKYILVL